MHTNEMNSSPADIYLLNEFRAINAHMPRRRKTLAELLEEEAPQIACGDGSAHFFKKKELALLADILDEEEYKALLLPMLIEVSVDDRGYSILSPKGVEMKILSKVLDMELSWSMNKVAMFKPHLSLLRKELKTCTQYVFIP